MRRYVLYLLHLRISVVGNAEESEDAVLIVAALRVVEFEQE